MKINDNYSRLEKSYLFSEIARRTAGKDVLRLGIGDVTLPLAPVVISAMQHAATEFRGYGEEQGYKFLRDAVVDYYAPKGVGLENSEVFISDGAKSDLGNILDIFSCDATVLIPNPVYPVYVDTNIMAGRKIVYAKWGAPDPEVRADIIYICSPNNPTGEVYNKDELSAWVEYAIANNAVILFDAAYEAFVRDPELPTSIYQIPNAKKCAIEFCSLSKTAGFTGVRCGWTIVPHETGLNELWLRRQTTKFNGVSYIVQRGAQAALSPQGVVQNRANIDHYMGNAKIIMDALDELGIEYKGGKNAPYIWLKCPDNMTSWQYFDHLLNKHQIVGTPGAGFGSAGEGHFRLSAFAKREDIVMAMGRLREYSILR